MCVYGPRHIFFPFFQAAIVVGWLQVPTTQKRKTIRVQEIAHHLDQMNKLWERLGDPVSPYDQIQRPVGMRRLLFDNRIERLARHERAIERKLINGLQRFGSRK